jgi:SAM-dependent methyltransferase
LSIDIFSSSWQPYILKIKAINNNKKTAYIIRSKKMNIKTVQKQLFAWGMGKANNADLSQIKVKNHPNYNNFSDLKQALLGQISGTVLEIGAGAGANFSYYPKNINWLGIEPNNFMFNHLEKEAQKQNIKSIKLTQGYAENLPFEDDSMDTVVSTHVLCSVKNVEESLREIYRVLKPNSQFIFLEHIGANHGTITRNLQTLIEPIWKRIFDNCHIQREPEKLLKTIGFRNIEYSYFDLPFPIVSPHVAGVAFK